MEEESVNGEFAPSKYYRQRLEERLDKLNQLRIEIKSWEDATIALEQDWCSSVKLSREDKGVTVPLTPYLKHVILEACVAELERCEHEFRKIFRES